MTHSEPRDFGKPIGLHDLFALMLAACVAIGAIAAALALLDDSVRQTGPAAATQTTSPAFAADGDSAHEGHTANVPSRAGQTKRR